jgi:two-component system response regulator AtoC
MDIIGSVWEAMDKLQSGATPNLLLMDLSREDECGLDALRWMRRLRAGLSVIVILRKEDVEIKQESIRIGALDCLVIPFDDQTLEDSVSRNLLTDRKATEPDIASEDVEPVGNGHFFIATSSAVRKLRLQVELLAQNNTPVLIRGEQGSGKETAARLLHKLSVRSSCAFAKVDCAALPAELLEREIFGHGDVAAAASLSAKPGKIERCIGGTIFLDKITEMPQRLQAKLLHVIESRNIARPGSSEQMGLDVRIVAGVSGGDDPSFLERALVTDLYRRLTVYEIHVPPLRERKEEIPFLSHHFMHRLSKQYGLPPREISQAIIDAWQVYDWPGNLDELERSVKRYLVMGDAELIEMSRVRDLEDHPKGAVHGDVALGRTPIVLASPSSANVFGAKSLRSLLQSVRAEAEKSAIALALERTGWNRKAAARLLKVSYRTILYKIDQYKLHSPDHTTLIEPGRFAVTRIEAGGSDSTSALA